MSKIVITVVGKDTVGIVAAVCTYLAENHINILDITQTILQDYFNMMMIVDVSRMEKTFDEMAKELAAVGEQKGVQVLCQREEIFTSMHRL
ncbi:MAG: ACT domain-containing protein [Clostridium sp.]|jgi:ACT domain-containing protein|nr:ACT domain-containing protein [Clostridium sp.]MBP3215866.1 ACT domain-containing protein [Clostridium sp.]HAE81297.1 ACT domain-containing protein [Lachnoclostridium sp.]